MILDIHDYYLTNKNLLAVWRWRATKAGHVGSSSRQILALLPKKTNTHPCCFHSWKKKCAISPYSRNRQSRRQQRFICAIVSSATLPACVLRPTFHNFQARYSSFVGAALESRRSTKDFAVKLILLGFFFIGSLFSCRFQKIGRNWCIPRYWLLPTCRIRVFVKVSSAVQCVVVDVAFSSRWPYTQTMIRNILATAAPLLVGTVGFPGYLLFRYIHQDCRIGKENKFATNLMFLPSKTCVQNNLVSLFFLGMVLILDTVVPTGTEAIVFSNLRRVYSSY